MKKKDFTLIIVVIIFSGVFSLLLSSVFLSSSEKRRASVEQVSEITTEFEEPDSRFFNDESINPTQTIRIQDAQNPTPFTENQDQ